MGFRDSGSLGFRDSGLEFRDSGLGLRDSGLGLRVGGRGADFRVSGLQRSNTKAKVTSHWCEYPLLVLRYA